MTALKKPFVLWLTGLSGAGKTTLGKAVYDHLKPSLPELVFIDGDLFREIVGDDLGHDPKARLENAYRISRFCRYMSSQRVSVICATMSLYPEIWEWNRANIPGYREVYLRVKTDVLKARDPKGIYARVAKGAEANVVGVDLPFDEPRQPDLILDNDESSPASIARQTQILVDFLGV